MKVRKIFACMLCLMIVCLGFAGCDFNKKFTVTISSENLAWGDVSKDPSTTEHKKGSWVTVIASPKSGYDFVSWIELPSKEVVHENPTYSFKIEENRTLQATFRKIIGVSFDLQGGKTENGATNIGKIEHPELGREITLPKLTKTGYNFVGWTDGKTEYKDENNVYTVTKTLTENVVLSAMFIAKTYRPVLKFTDSIEGTDLNGNAFNYTLTYDAPIPKLPKAKSDNEYYIWKYGNESEEFDITDKTWKNDVANEKTIVFTATKVAAKTFTFEMEGDEGAKQFKVKIPETKTDVFTINGLKCDNDETINVEKNGYTYNGFYDKALSEEDRVYYTKVSYNEPQTEPPVVDPDEGEQGGEEVPEIETREVKENIAFDSTKIYKVSYTKNLYHVTYDEKSLEKVDIVAIPEGSGTDIYFDETFCFTVTPKVQGETELSYEIDRVYYIETEDDKNTQVQVSKNIINEVECYYIPKMPASAITIYVEVLTKYNVKFFDGETPVLLDEELLLVEKEVKTFKAIDSNTNEFDGWSVKVVEAATEEGQEPTVSYVKVVDNNGNMTENFWEIVNSQNYENFIIELYVNWAEVVNQAEYKFIYNNIREGSEYFITPMGFGEYNNEFSIIYKGNSNLFNYINLLETDLTSESIDALNNVTYVHETHKDFYKYNFKQMLDKLGNIKQAGSFTNMLVVCKPEAPSGETPVVTFVKTDVYISITIRDAEGHEVANNSENVISKSVLEQFKHGWSMTIDVQAINK